MLQTKTKPSTLAEVRDALLALPHPFTRDAVHSAVEGLQPQGDELDRHLNFSERGYTRTLFYGGPRFEMLVLCWKAAQASPIHDHAASICSMAVVEGVAHGENYQLTGGRAPCSVEDGGQATLELTGTRQYETGQVVTVVGGDIHRIAPAPGSERLVTVHFYLPPITSMRCFDQATGRCRISEPETLLPRS